MSGIKNIKKCNFAFYSFLSLLYVLDLLRLRVFVRIFTEDGKKTDKSILRRKKNWSINLCFVTTRIQDLYMNIQKYVCTA